MLHQKPWLKILFLFGIMISIPLRAETASPLSAEFEKDLEQNFSIVAAEQNDIRALLKQALLKSKTTSLADFLKQVVRFCDLDGRQAARVHQVSEERTFYLTRSLEEPVAATPTQLKEFYSERVGGLIPKGVSLATVAWSFDPDFIKLRTDDDKSEICIKPGMTANSSIEYLAHEMVHYTSSEDLHQATDILRFKDARDYSEKAVLTPGDEVDAYKLEYSLRIRRQGKDFLRDQPLMAHLYTDDGKYLGRDEHFAKLVLDEMGYYKFRFRLQYHNLLQNQIQSEEEHVKLDQSLLENRKTQEREIKVAIEARSGLIEHLSAKYKADKERFQEILRRDLDSQERLKKDLSRREELLQQLKQKERLYQTGA
jgi:hypothetical protein